MHMTSEAAIARLTEHKRTMDKYITPTTDRHNSVATLVRAEEKAIAALQEQAAKRWIPVTERLPTEDEYLMRRGDNSYYGPIAVAFQDGPIIDHALGCFDGKLWSDYLCIHPIHNVIAWKPFEEYQEPAGKR